MFSYNELKKNSEEFFKSHLLNRDQVHNGKDYIQTPTSHPITHKSLLSHLNHGSFSILTAQNPGGSPLRFDMNIHRNWEMEKELRGMGAIYHRVVGHYGGNKENSFLVHHTRKVRPEHLEALAKKYGQESISHSSAGQHRLKYVTGEHMGKYHEAKNFIHDPKAKENYTHPEKKPKSKFSIGYDFSTMQKNEKEPKKLSGFDIVCDDGSEHHIHFNFGQDLKK